MRYILLFLVCFLLSGVVQADSMRVNMYRTVAEGQGQSLGNIIATDTQYGLLLIPNLHGLSAGIHGFHVHENPSCADSGKAAGGHLDPQKTGNHLGPYTNKGHLGDLPALTVDAKGHSDLPVLAPRLKVSDLPGHSLMIHAGGDNYADVPNKLGGGGARIACGVVVARK